MYYITVYAGMDAHTETFSLCRYTSKIPIGTALYVFRLAGAG